jgi:hypothetical protein
MNKCEAKTKAGEPCGMPALVGGDRCFNHARGAEAVEKRIQARSAGGRARAEQMKRAEQAERDRPDWWALTENSEIEEAIAHVARQTIEGRMSAREARAATAALKLLLDRAGMHDALMDEYRRG